MPLDLSHLPPTYLLPTHLTPHQLQTLTAQLRACNCPLAPLSTATLFLGDISTAKRSAYELRCRGIKTVPLPLSTPTTTTSSTPTTSTSTTIHVVKLQWLSASLSAASPLPMAAYTVYHAAITSISPRASPRAEKAAADARLRREIMERVRRDVARSPNRASGGGAPGGDVLRFQSRPHRARAPPRPTTPEYEAGLDARRRDDMPEWVQQRVWYSCCRRTPAVSPNTQFIAELRTVRLSRQLAAEGGGGREEGVGVRAYSTFIAVLQAYPYLLRSGAEVGLLPGCDVKATALFNEWLHSAPDDAQRGLAAVRELEAAESFRTLRSFTQVCGVGPAVAREWYYGRGWRSLDDVVENGWEGLGRMRQVGIKYFDEFREGVQRGEAERIVGVIGRHAERLRPGVGYVLTGAYRRGEDMSGVQVLVSHPEAEMVGFVAELIASLESEGWITHTLHLGGAMEDEDDYSYGSDTLEKALVVWQEVERGDVFGPRNGNAHRRVDIVVAPAQSVGMAMLAWTGATTFERDLRLWCEKKRGWLFSSEGIFEKDGTRVQEVDGTWREGESMEDAEKRVFERLGLKWLAPEERCTG